jgi:hypothetical protein
MAICGFFFVCCLPLCLIGIYKWLKEKKKEKVLCFSNFKILMNFIKKGKNSLGRNTNTRSSSASKESTKSTKINKNSSNTLKMKPLYRDKM